MHLNWVSKYRWRIIGNLVFWVAYGFFLFYTGRMMGNVNVQGVQVALLILAKVLCFGVPSYFNNLVLIPRLLQRQLTGRYFLALIATMAVFSVLALPVHKAVYWVYPMLERFETPAVSAIIDYFIELCMFVLVFALVDLARNSLIYKRKLETMEKERLETELENLRAQINPHFLFNALNTVYGLSDKDKVRTSEAILQLSDILRYVLYECSDATVPLAKEMEFIENYIDFSWLRAGDEMRVSCELPRGDLSNKFIPPMIIMPLVENAFKHGVGEADRWLKLHIWCADDHLFMDISNSSLPGARQPSGIKTGIGLDNVTKRLQLLFEDQYEFIITDKGTEFKVHLKIPISHA